MLGQDSRFTELDKGLDWAVAELRGKAVCCCALLILEFLLPWKAIMCELPPASTRWQGTEGESECERASPFKSILFIRWQAQVQRHMRSAQTRLACMGHGNLSNVLRRHWRGICWRPTDRINLRIPYSSSKAQDEGDSRDHGL